VIWIEENKNFTGGNLIMSKESKIPDFTTFQEAREFWEKHSLTNFTGELEEAKEVKFVRKDSLVVSLKLEKDDEKRLRQLAKKKGVKYSDLIPPGLKSASTKVDSDTSVVVACCMERLTLSELIHWTEISVIEADFDDKDYETLRDIISRLGLADVKAFGIKSFKKKLTLTESRPSKPASGLSITLSIKCYNRRTIIGENVLLLFILISAK